MTASARDTDRAISTVFDVSLALLLISASVVTIATYLNDSERAHEASKADRTAQTLAAATTTMSYSLEPIDDPINGHDPFTHDSSYNYERTTHGTFTALFAEAAVSEAKFPDGDSSTVYDPDSRERLTRAGVEYADALDGKLREKLTGVHDDVHVVAVWEPYEDATIRGRVEAGPQPPSDVDVSTATMTVPSQVPAIDDDEIERAWRLDGISGVADLVAAAMIEGYFPPGETQVALENSPGGFDREHVLYRYLRMAEVVDDDPTASVWDTTPAFFGSVGPGPSPRPLSRTQASATRANELLAEELSEMVEADMTASSRYDPSTSAETVADRITAGEVTVVVYSWNE